MFTVDPIDLCCQRAALEWLVLSATYGDSVGGGQRLSHY